MIGHNAPRDQLITDPVKSKECLFEDLRQFRSPQGATTMTGIQPLFDPLPAESLPSGGGLVSEFRFDLPESPERQ
jgi:hypothetical protein